MVSNLTVDVDNNDDYVVQYSTDNVHFTTLFDFLASYGPVPVSPGGMEILTTIPTYPTNPSDNTTPAYVGSGFSPVQASYLRIFAQAGDNAYAIGEIQAFASVPEPSSVVLAGIAVAAGMINARRKASRARPERKRSENGPCPPQDRSL